MRPSFAKPLINTTYRGHHLYVQGTAEVAHPKRQNGKRTTTSIMFLLRDIHSTVFVVVAAEPTVAMHEVRKYTYYYLCINQPRTAFRLQIIAKIRTSSWDHNIENPPLSWYYVPQPAVSSLTTGRAFTTSILFCIAAYISYYETYTYCFVIFRCSILLLIRCVDKEKGGVIKLGLSRNHTN